MITVGSVVQILSDFSSDTQGCYTGCMGIVRQIVQGPLRNDPHHLCQVEVDCRLAHCPEAQRKVPTPPK